MLQKMIVKWLFKTGKYRSVYKRLAVPSARGWADYLRIHGGFAGIGVDCEINVDAVVTDPYLVRLGNHVSLSSCHLISHDGSIRQLQRALDIKVDAVGKIDILDNCFIGYNATILRNVRIGPNAIVAAGAVVSKDVPENAVVGGVPAKFICTIEDLGKRLECETSSLPWSYLIRERNSSFDAILEARMQPMRAEYFWMESKTPQD